MKSFDTLTENFISIFNLPLEENWEEYLRKDHLNFFAYMISLGIAGVKEFEIEKTASYRIKMNPGLSTLLSKNSNYFNCEDLNGKVVVDVGCGWGFLSFWFLLCEAKEVVAVGFPYQITFIEKLRDAALKRNLISEKSKLTCVEKPISKGDRDIGNLGEGYADLIAYIEVFEHIPNDIFDDAIIASFNSLKPGGLLISTCHNTDNKSIRNEVSKYWDRLEKEYLLENRKKLIESKISNIASQDLENLASLTRGLMMKEFNLALNEFEQNGTFPIENEEIRPAVDLTYDYICENYISPGSVVNKMKKAGFTAQCYPGIRHSRRFMPLWPIEKLMGNLLMNIDSLSKNVVFLGKKPLK